jgi:hypothetical protein
MRTSERRSATDGFREERCVFIIHLVEDRARKANETESFPGVRVARRCERDPRAARPEGGVRHDVSIDLRQVCDARVFAPVATECRPPFVFHLGLEHDAEPLDRTGPAGTRKSDPGHVSRRDHARVQQQPTRAVAGDSGVEDAFNFLWRTVRRDDDPEPFARHA